ncbi:uncharacterized protein BDV17DRAFT_281681 [Aspergillus undulatus]|uniref:uncharacterized protein n=1 Tax=Aspergillus undulatus TaxID=1810928 RepID=UPI003CCD0A8E
MGDESPTSRQLFVEALIFCLVEDYVMTATFLIYTSPLVLIQVSSHHETNLIDSAEYYRVLSDPQQVRNRIIGSKIVIGLEQCMLLTRNLRLLLYVKVLTWYVAAGFAVIMMTYYALHRRPFSQYWAMPAVFYISSDAAMLAIPAPLLIKDQIKRTKKVLLVCIMSLGVFTMVAAILNKAFNFVSPLTTTYQLWYIREASTTIYVANLVCIWPLLRKVFGSAAVERRNDPNRAQTWPSDATVDSSAIAVVNNRRARAPVAGS